MSPRYRAIVEEDINVGICHCHLSYPAGSRWRVYVICFVGLLTIFQGIAHVAALAGYDVILSDVEMARAEAARATIAKNLGRGVSKGAVAQGDADAALARIALTTDSAAFAAADLVI
ncbi:hypothetical protein FM036_47645, partial [Nostoc sp. HG1]|nr:hypothetical protein [Nostoc sp. HG1]